jgi:hypothetical protein
MNKVKFKVTGYDAAAKSLLISFASDTTASQDPADYVTYAFQPLIMWPDVTDITELKKCIAQAGMYHVEMQEADEKFVVDDTRIAAIQALVGQTHEFTVAELTATDFNTPLATV